MHKFLKPNGLGQLMFYYQEPEMDKDVGEWIGDFLEYISDSI